MYVSHFSAPGCGGSESYYLPYDGWAFSCRTWDGSSTAQCGTIRRNVTNDSARINAGPCQDLWPSGNTLSDFVTIVGEQKSRVPLPSPGGGTHGVLSVNPRYVEDMRALAHSRITRSMAMNAPHLC